MLSGVREDADPRMTFMLMWWAKDCVLRLVRSVRRSAAHLNMYQLFDAVAVLIGLRWATVPARVRLMTLGAGFEHEPYPDFITIAKGFKCGGANIKKKEDLDDALREMLDSKGPYVFVVGKDDKVERRDVQVGGTISAGIIITGGLTGQERIVTTAAGFLREGEKVAIAPPATGATAS